jgi:hypothetical protein
LENTCGEGKRGYETKVRRERRRGVCREGGDRRGIGGERGWEREAGGRRNRWPTSLFVPWGIWGDVDDFFIN